MSRGRISCQAASGCTSTSAAFAAGGDSVRLVVDGVALLVSYWPAGYRVPGGHHQLVSVQVDEEHGVSTGKSGRR